MADAPDINVDELRRRARRRLLGAVVLALAAAVIVPDAARKRSQAARRRRFGQDPAGRTTASSSIACRTRARRPARPRPQRSSEPAKEAVQGGTAAAAPRGCCHPSREQASPTLPPPKKSIAHGRTEDAGRAVQACGLPPATAPSAGPAATAPAAPPAPTGNTAAMRHRSTGEARRAEGRLLGAAGRVRRRQGRQCAGEQVEKGRLPRIYGAADDEQGHVVARARRPVSLARVRRSTFATS